MRCVSRIQSTLLNKSTLFTKSSKIAFSPVAITPQKRHGHQRAINFTNRLNAHTNYPVAVVFGCSGFIGRYVVGALSDLGYQVIIPYRLSDYDIIGLKCLGDVGQIIPMRFSIDKYDTLIDIVSRSNVVINSIGRDVDRIFDDNMHKSNVFSTQQIVKACKEANVDRYVHVSCMNADSKHESKYWASKGESEEHVKKELPGATIIRPNYVYGTEDRFLNWIAKSMRFTIGVPLINQGTAKVQPVYCVDVGDAIANAATSQYTYGKTIELNGPKEYTWNELAHFTAEVIQEPVHKVFMPQFLGNILGKMNEYTWGPAFTKDLMIRMKYDCVQSDRTNNMTFKDVGVKVQRMEDVSGQFLAQWDRRDVDKLKLNNIKVDVRH